MSGPSDNAVGVVLAGRRRRLERALGRRLAPIATGPMDSLREHARSHLLEEAHDLYWNELEWENVTAEEALDEGSLTELAFPALLAFVDGLLLTEPIGEAPARAAPRVDVVEDILRFLASRVVELRADRAPETEEGRQARAELAMATRLIDLVMYRLYGLSPEQIERIEVSGASPEGG